MFDKDRDKIGQRLFILGAVGIGLALVIAVISLSSLMRRPGGGASDWPAGTASPTVSATQGADVREPAVAGSFYPADATVLRADLVRLLRSATVPDGLGAPRLVIAPHAGYDYAGPVAAHAFKTLIGSGYRRVVLIGRSHSFAFAGVVADGHETWRTPLGDVQVDRDFLSRLVKATDVVRVDSEAHATEHGLEVMVPFLQETLGPDFTIVPLLLGSGDPVAQTALADALRRTIDDSTAIVVSTDLSHYPKAADAARLDAATVAAIVAGDADKFSATLREMEKAGTAGVETLACGESAVAAGLRLARAFGWRGRLLDYANSGDTHPEQKDRVVGYAAVAFYPADVQANAPLDQAAQASALALARSSIAAVLNIDQAAPPPVAAGLAEMGGVFVTLRKGGELRGCIGTFDGSKSLYSNIRAMAVEAALRDSRFAPLTAEELPQITIEISVLSPTVRLYDPELIELGKHGVVIRQGARSGVFLPQVATEQRWDLPTMLGELCTQKAGLPSGCWRDSRTEIGIFTAQVFAETD